MDSYEATTMVFSRIQSLDRENASKIMGYLLIQDQGEKEMIRLAFGPESLLHSLIIKAKTQLGLSSNGGVSQTPISPSPFQRPSPLSLTSSRLGNSNNGFDFSNPSSPSTNPWSLPDLRSPSNTMMSPSYANIVNGTNGGSLSSPTVSSLKPSFPFYSNGGSNNDFIEDYQLQEQLSFLNDSKSDELFDPRGELAGSPGCGGGGGGGGGCSGYNESPLHRRSFSVPGISFGSDEMSSGFGFGWKPCLYFARGFCKNGSSCRFLHGDHQFDPTTAAAAIVGSPSKLNEFEQCQEILRSKQKLSSASASQFMAAGASFPYHKCMNYLLQQQNDSPRSAAAALMMEEELHKFGRCRSERNGFSGMGLGGLVNPGSRQIYLTFPADSTFREEDVSNYFSIYGPVQDVRIPYQQKRMFGFVTFLYPETVKLILAKGNPHFVCDSRVLVKPYKEKGKIPDKKQQHQQLERGDYSACSSPSGLDPRDPFDLHLGSRMLYNSQDMMMSRRTTEEQLELQQAIELHGRRMMNLQLLDIKNHQNIPQYPRGLSNGSPVPSPTVSNASNNPFLIFPADGLDQEVPKENSDGAPVGGVDGDGNKKHEVNPACGDNIDNGKTCIEEAKFNIDESDLHESLEHILPDNLFASPKKSVADERSSPTSTTSNNNSPSLLSPLKSCFLQIPRFPSGHGTIGL